MCSPLPWFPRTPTPSPITGGLSSPRASPTDACLPVGMEHKLDMAAAPGTLLCVIARVLAATVTIVARHCAERAGGCQLASPWAQFSNSSWPLCLAASPCPLVLPPPAAKAHPRVPGSHCHPSGLTFTVPLVLGELEARAAFTGNAPFGRLPANVSTAMVLVHAVHSF